jgi:uncharacterized protein
MGKKAALLSRLEEIKKEINRDFPVEKMILFGSNATGKTHKDSDIDLIIVSPKFKGLDFMQRGSKMYDYWSLTDQPVDFICYTPEEYKKRSKGVTMVGKAMIEGIKI